MRLQDVSCFVTVTYIKLGLWSCLTLKASAWSGKTNCRSLNLWWKTTWIWKNLVYCACVHALTQKIIWNKYWSGNKVFIIWVICVIQDRESAIALLFFFFPSAAPLDSNRAAVPAVCLPEWRCESCWFKTRVELIFTDAWSKIVESWNGLSWKGP